jgi:hypothetical protein
VAERKAAVWIPKALDSVQAFFTGDNSETAKEGRRVVCAARERLKERKFEILVDWDIPLFQNDSDGENDGSNSGNDDSDEEMGGT